MGFCPTAFLGLTAPILPAAISRRATTISLFLTFSLRRTGAPL